MYLFEYRIGLLQYFVIPEADHSIAFGCESCRSFIIVVALFCVLTAIGFDDQFRFKADEIDDVGWDGYLSVEFVAVEVTVAQVSPE